MLKKQHFDYTFDLMPHHTWCSRLELLSWLRLFNASKMSTRKNDCNFRSSLQFYLEFRLTKNICKFEGLLHIVIHPSERILISKTSNIVLCNDNNEWSRPYDVTENAKCNIPNALYTGPWGLTLIPFNTGSHIMSIMYSLGRYVSYWWMLIMTEALLCNSHCHFSL